MFKVALQMLIGDKAKYTGIIIGLSFAALIITQQAAIFLGIVLRMFGFITDTSQPNVWVMDPKIQFVDDVKPMKETVLYRIRGIDGIEWAVPLYKGMIRARLPTGVFQNCIIIGIDDSTLIGGPPRMVQGKVYDLRKSDSIIVDKVGAETKLATEKNGYLVPLRVGDTMELNDHYSVVVGISRNTKTFQSQPVIYTTYKHATYIVPQERKMLSFVLAHTAKNVDDKKVCRKITALTGLAAYTKDEFISLTVNYFLRKTGIAVNFGITVLLGFIIGTIIAAQTFYNFTLDNLRFFGTFKAMGADNKLLRKMILLQAIWVGFIGWGIGVGAAGLIAFSTKNTELSFYMPVQLFIFSGIAIFSMCTLSAIISIRKVMKLEPAIVFKS
jgi:putative ABC transport system permease protein